MPSNPNEQNRLAMLGAVAVPVAGLAYLAARRFWSAAPSAQAPHPKEAMPTTPPGEWTTREVRAWLLSIDANAEVVSAFERDDVDGATLPLLSEGNLQAMGITKVSHRLKTIRSIRVVFGLPVDTASLGPTPAPSVAPSAAPSPSTSAARTRRHADPVPAPVPAPMTRDAEDGAATADAAAPDSTDDGDEIVGDGREAMLEGITQRDRGHGEVSSVADKIRAWRDVLSSDAFAAAEHADRQRVLQDAARDLAQIARLLQSLPASPPINELKAAASELMRAIAAANDGLQREAAAAPKDDANNGVMRVAELLEQFQSVLTAPDLLKLPADQRASITSGIAAQLNKIKDNVLPALPAQHARPLADSIGALLSICAKLNDPDVIAQLGHPRQADATAAAAAATTSSEEDGRPTPASLQFIVTRLRNIFDEIRSDAFLGEPDADRVRERVANAARNVHALTLEGDHLPDDQRSVVRQVADNIMSVLTKVLESVQQREGGAAPAAPKPAAAAAEDRDAPTSREELEVAQLLSKQLVAMLNVLKSEAFENASGPQRAAVAAKMGGDLDKMGSILEEQPREVRELLEPTREKLKQFIAAVTEDAAHRQGPAADPEDGEDEEAADEEGEEAADPAPPSQEFLGLNGQMKEILNIVASKEFATQATPKKLDVIMQCQQLLGTLVKRIERLRGPEHQVAMHNAQQVNQRLKAVADPLLADAESADSESDGANDDGAAAPTGGASQAKALEVVQRTQALFQSIDADDFLHAPKDQRERRSAAMNAELAELTKMTSTLDPEARASITPLLGSLAAVLGKLTAVLDGAASADVATGDDAEEDEAAQAPGTTDDDRTQVYRLAESTTAAIASGRLRITSVDGVEQLSQLLALLEKCGCRDAAEINVRERFQHAVETVLGQLSEAMAAADGADEGEGEEEAEDDDEEEEEEEEAGEDADSLTELLTTLVSVLDHAQTEEQIAKVLPHLQTVAKGGTWRSNPRHVDLLARAMKIVETKRRQFAETGGAADGDSDVATVKRALGAINRALPTADAEQLSVLIKQLTTLTDSTALWKADPEAVALVNNAIRGIQQASVRLQPGAAAGLDGAVASEDDGDAAAPSREESRLSRMLREAAARIREGADASPFLPLAATVAERRSRLTEEECDALDDFEDALQRVADRSPTTPGSPPNTPAVGASAPRQAVSNDDDEEEEEEEEEEDEDEDDDEAPDAVSSKPSEANLLQVLEQVKERIAATEVTSFQDLAPYIGFLQKLRAGPTTPRTDAAIREVEDMLRAHITSLEGRGDNLRAQAVDMKRRQMRQIAEIVSHPNFTQLDAEQRTSTLRRGMQLLGELSPAEQEALRTEAALLIGALDDATTREDAALGVASQVTAMADLALLPRIIERLGAQDFMENCSAFEVKAIGATLARIQDSPALATNAEFKPIVQQASQVFSERVSNYEGSAKSSKAVSCPLEVTGMASESSHGHPVLRYTMFSPEESDSYTANDAIVGRFKRAMPEGGEPVLPAGGVESWRGKSVALLFTFEASPLDEESANETAQSETTMLAEILEDQHGFEIIRCNDVPTPGNLTDAVASLNKYGPLERLFIYFSNPPLRSAELAPPPQHSVVFANGEHVRHASIVEMAKAHAAHVVLFHDVGSAAEVLAWTREDGMSHHIGASVTEAAFLVSNASRCWLYDGLVAPILLESLSCDARTLCAEDLVSSVVRTLIARDGCDGPHTRDSAASRRAFFAPGLEDHGEDEE